VMSSRVAGHTTEEVAMFAFMAGSRTLKYCLQMTWRESRAARGRLRGGEKGSHSNTKHVDMQEENRHVWLF
jgi:hypothetical protein